MTTSDDRSDTELLLAFGRDGDEAAFGVLAARHVDMIFSVSVRRSGNRQLAEEATQNVLLGLSMKAQKLALQESSLSGWLHTATKFEVAKLQRRETRIKRREQAYATDQMKTSTQSDDETFLQLVPLLDQAIDQLRASDREVIVRRYLEGQDFRRIGEALGISEDTAQKRTSRAFESLNRFFKLKAGVTVTVTALAAGISQHCVEAAPAGCLQIAGKAVPTGLGSLYSTSVITTMSTGKIAAVVAGIILVGGSVVFFSNRGSSPSDNRSTFPSSSSTTGLSSAAQSPEETVSRSTGGNAIPAASVKPYSPNEELAKLEAMSPHPSQDEMARRLSVKHGQMLKDLTTELSLNEGQVAGLKRVLDSRLKDFRTSLDHKPVPGAPPEQREKEIITKAGSLIRGVGLREELAGVLSEGQLATFTEREEKIRQSQVESLAYRELARIAPVLGLNEEQKNRVFELLQLSSSEKLKQDGDARAFMALMQNQAPAQMELTDLAEADFFNEVMDGPNALTPDSPDVKKRIIEFVSGRTNHQIELLAPVLDPGQKQRYYDHLISRSMLPMLGIKAPTPEKK